MIDPVHSQATGAVGRPSTAVSGAAAAVASVTSDTPSSAATVRTTARTLADLGPPVDAERVAALKSAIADGSYSIDPGKIADALIVAASEQR